MQKIFGFLGRARLPWLLALVLMTSCTWERRQPLTAATIGGFPRRPGSALVTFLPVLPNARLDDTVWDNAVGPFYDPIESRRIGFDQNYRPQFDAIPVANLPQVARPAAMFVDSRILVPFGRILTGVFESAIAQSYAAHATCYTDPCEPTRSLGPEPVVRIALKVDSFVVWEAPLNHINMYVRGSASTTDARGSILESLPFEHSVLDEELGSFFSTHASMIRKMNEIADDLAGAIVVAVLRELT